MGLLYSGSTDRLVGGSMSVDIKLACMYEACFVLIDGLGGAKRGRIGGMVDLFE